MDKDLFDDLTASLKEAAHIAKGWALPSRVLRPVRRPCTLEELVAGITPENRTSETDWGAAKGNEV